MSGRPCPEFTAEALPDGRFRVSLPSGAVVIVRNRTKAKILEAAEAVRRPNLKITWKEST